MSRVWLLHCLAAAVISVSQRSFSLFSVNYLDPAAGDKSTPVCLFDWLTSTWGRRLTRNANMGHNQYNTYYQLTLLSWSLVGFVVVFRIYFETMPSFVSSLWCFLLIHLVCLWFWLLVSCLICTLHFVLAFSWCFVCGPCVCLVCLVSLLLFFFMYFIFAFIKACVLFSHSCLPCVCLRSGSHSVQLKLLHPIADVKISEAYYNRWVWVFGLKLRSTFSLLLLFLL